MSKANSALKPPKCENNPNSVYKKQNYK